MNSPVVFVSDLHLDEMVPERLQRFERFLFEDLASLGCKDLYILGDVFNVWYRDCELAETYGDRILDLLARFREQGGQLEMVVGNRDFALCFDRTLDPPFPIHEKAIERMIGPRRFYLCHGDDLARKDYGYRVMHNLIRRKFPLAVFHSLGTSGKRFIVRALIGISQEVKKRKSIWRREAYRPFLADLVDGGIDVCIQGHRHSQAFRIIDGNIRSGRHFVLPRWFDRSCGLIYYPSEDRFRFFSQ